MNAVVAKHVADAERVAPACIDRTLPTMTERFERHRQPWTPTEIQKLHQMANKGMSLKAICNSLKRSEESVKIRAKLDKLVIVKLR